MLLKPDQTILFEGDSMTQRRMAPTLDDWAFLRLANWHQNFGDLVAEWCLCLLPEWRLTFRNGGVGGSNIRGLLERLPKYQERLKPDWVVVTVGNNDPVQGVTQEEFEAGFDKYCRMIREHSGGRVMFLGGFLESCPTDSPHFEKRQQGKAYHEAAGEIVKRYDGIYVNAGRDIAKKAKALLDLSEYHVIYGDGLHFNALGNHVMAGIVMKALGVATFPGWEGPPVED